MGVRLCKAGLHPMTAANRYEHPQKGLECRACKRAYMRTWMREKRAREKASRRPRTKKR